MATKTAQCNGSRGQYYGIEMTYTENSYSIENNSSNITISGKIKATSAGWSYYGFNNTGTIKINGTQAATGTSSAKVDTNGVTLVTFTGDYPHNADGSLTLSIQFDFSTTYSYLSNTSVSDTAWKLYTIPRASSISATNANIGSNSTISISTASSSFTHTLTYSFTGTSTKTGTIATKTSLTSVPFSVPDNIYEIIPNSTYIDGTITCTTFSGNTSIGSKTCSIRVFAVENTCKPTINANSYSVDNTTSTLANGTTFIANVTTATISIQATRNKSSTLKKVGVFTKDANNKYYPYKTSDINSTSGTFTITLNPSEVRSTLYYGVIDSRGYATYSSGYIPTTFKSYVVLTADSSAKIARTNQTEAIVKITQFNGNYWNDSFRSGNANTLTIQWRYKESTEAWGSQTYYTIPSSSVSISNNTYTISNYTLTNGTTTELFDYQKAYNIQFSVTDKVGTKTSNYTITAGVPNFAIFPDRAMVNNDKLMVRSDLDYFNDTAATDIYDLLRKKINLVETQLADVENGSIFLNGGWQGTNYAFGYGAKIGANVTHVMFCMDSVVWIARRYINTYSYTCLTNEFGSTNNGDYVKYPNGTMICWVRKDFTGIPVNNASGNLYVSADLSLPDFPVAFTSVPSVSYSVSNANWTINSVGVSTNNSPSTTNPGKVIVCRGGSTGSGVVAFTINVQAIGKWK